jgi:hypothetical protein
MADDKEGMLRTGFCTSCLSGSTDKSPGNISTINGIGRKFYGGADKCTACGSTVRVLWIVLFYVPLIPLGTYRYQRARGGGLSSRFLARNTAMRWPQVFVHWTVGLALGAVGFALIMAFAASKGKR